jgi:hypothetical protein
MANAQDEARIRNVLRRTAHAAGFNVPKAGENDREIRKSVAGRIQGIEVDIYASQDTVKLVLDDLHVTQAEAIIGYIKTLKRIA